MQTHAPLQPARRRLLALLAVVALVVFGAAPATAQDDANKCIVDRLKELPELSLLSGNLGAAPDVLARVQKCDAGAPLTLLVPNNDAVIQAVGRITAGEQKAGPGELSERQKAKLGALAALHIASGNYSLADFRNASVSVLNTTMANRPEFVALRPGDPQRVVVVAPGGGAQAALLGMERKSKYSDGASRVIVPNGDEGKYRDDADAKVVRGDIRCKDGYIHVVDKVLRIPKNTTRMLKESDLDGFLALVKAAGAKDWLNNQTGITILAPNDRALKQLNHLIANKTITLYGSAALSRYKAFYRPRESTRTQLDRDDNGKDDEPDRGDAEKLKELLAQPKDRLLALVKAHVVNGTIYSPEFVQKPNATLTTLNGTRISVRASQRRIPFADEDDVEGRGASASGAGLGSKLRRWLQAAKPQNASSFQVGNATILFANILTRNGVIHVLDGVLGVNVTAPGPGPKPADRREKDVRPTALPPLLIVPKPNKTAPSLQSTPAGLVCLNITGIAARVAVNASRPRNETVERAGLKQEIVVGEEPTCPETDRVCYVAALSNTCAPPPSPFTQGAPIDLVTAKPSEIEAQYANKITFVPRCYNPKTHVCANNNFLCPVTHPATCGDACFDPAQYRCFARFMLCPAHAPNLCGQACFSAEQYECQRGTLKQKGAQPASTGAGV